MIHFDFSVNIATVVPMLLLLGTIINYGRKIVAYLSSMSYRVNVMWGQFEKDHPDLARVAEIEWNA